MYHKNHGEFRDYKILAENLNKPYEEIEKLCDRNNWFIGQEAVDLGIVDKVLCK